MNRLTYWNEEYGCWSYHCASGDAAKRLAEYENTGFEPAEINELLSDIEKILTFPLFVEATADPTNEPLTLNELHEMDGEPVWIFPVKKTSKISARWMLVSGYDPKKDRYLFTPSANITQGYDGKSYGKTWLAYRHEPEEADNAAQHTLC